MQLHGLPAPPLPLALVADDDVHMRALMAKVVRGLGFSVTELPDGWELVETLRKLPPPALVVTDLQMPGYTGLRVIRYARRLRLEMPIILVTGFGNPRIHVEAARLGASGVLDKPFSVEALRTLVNELLGEPDSGTRSARRNDGN